MDQFNKEKILSYYYDALAIRQGNMPRPRAALVYPTYQCNCSCTYCLYKGMNNIGKQPEMTVPDFVRLIDELEATGVKAVELCGGGEPLLYPYITDVIKYIAARDLELGVFTNGSTLNRHYKLLVDNATYVRVSLDTIDRETYKNMKRPTDHSLEDIINNIYTMVTYRDTVKSKCSLGLKVVLSQYNLSEVPQLIDFADTSLVDYIQFKGVRSDFNELSSRQEKETQEYLEQHRSNKIRGNLIKTALQVPCTMSPIHTMIDAYGDVYICCYYQYRKGRMKIGNIHAQSFNEIWHSDKHREKIKDINMVECNKYDCRFHHYNKVMNEVVDKNEMHINFI